MSNFEEDVRAAPTATRIIRSALPEQDRAGGAEKKGESGHTDCGKFHGVCQYDPTPPMAQRKEAGLLRPLNYDSSVSVNPINACCNVPLQFCAYGWNHPGKPCSTESNGSSSDSRLQTGSNRTSRCKTRAGFRFHGRSWL